MPLVASLELLGYSLDEPTIAVERVASNPRHISTKVKLAVFERDGGACVNCGIRQDIQFDHVIPVARGGSSS